METGRASTDVPGSDKSVKTILKWCFPPFVCFLCFCFQSVMLHMTTAKYVVLPTSRLHEDVGHHLLPYDHVPMSILDTISGGAAMVVIAGLLALGDLRLWVKLFFSNGILFVIKGVFDWMTVLPDSIGFEECKKRLNGKDNDAPLQYLERMGHLSGSEYLSALLQLELRGVGGKWPVRYCADMLMSGHTFVLVLYLLALADLVRRITILMPPGSRLICRVFIGLFAAVCTGADLYLIVKNHFHYTVDVVMAIIVTMLVYTNAGMAVLTQWYVADGKRNSQDSGLIWLPAVMIPFCCVHGYYSVAEMEEQQVLDLQAENQSSAWQWITEQFQKPEEVINSEEVQSYGSVQQTPQKSEAEAEGRV